MKAGESDVVKWTSKLCCIFSKLDQSNPEREIFMGNAIKWSAKDSPWGNPFLHQASKFSYVKRGLKTIMFFSV